jgi:hypothetical protein
VADFALSSDGRLLAVPRGQGRLEVRPIDPLGAAILVTRPGGCHHRGVDVSISREGQRMIVHAGGREYWVNWQKPELEIRCSGKPMGALPNEPWANRTAITAYDPRRFHFASQGTLTAVVDVFGQIFLFDQQGNLSCAFFVFRGQFAAWMPDGTRYGPEELTGGPATPDALKRIGEALRNAGKPGTRTAP